MANSSPPKKQKYSGSRRGFLAEPEVERLMRAARKIGRNGHRDATMILICYRHGLRVSELVALKWIQVDLEQGHLHVHRRKNGQPSTHPLRGPELRALRKMRRGNPHSPYVFLSERKGPISDRSFRHIVSRAGQLAGLDYPVHPHMLRHSTGFKLANDGQDTRAIQHYLGHKQIQHTVRYTELSPARFENFWQD